MNGFEPQETVIRFTDEYTGKMETPTFWDLYCRKLTLLPRMLFVIFIFEEMTAQFDSTSRIKISPKI